MDQQHHQLQLHLINTQQYHQPTSSILLSSIHVDHQPPSRSSSSVPSSSSHHQSTSSSSPSTFNLNHLKSGLAGGIAGCLAKSLVSPLDRVKILFQTSHPDYSKYSGSIIGVFRAIGAIWNHSGLRGLVQGHSVTLIRIFPYAGIKFMSYDILHKALMPQVELENPTRRFLAGATSGVMAVLLTYPFEIVRVRTAIETRSSPDQIIRIRDVIRSIYLERPSSPSNWDLNLFQKFPVLKFYRGFAPTISGMVPYAGTSFLVWGTLQSKLPTYLPSGISDSVMVSLLCGSLAGMIAQTVSYPLEIIRRKMQVGGPMTHRTILETTRLILNTRGPKGFFVGLSIGYVKVIPMTAISFVTWSKLKIRFE